MAIAKLNKIVACFVIFCTVYLLLIFIICYDFKKKRSQLVKQLEDNQFSYDLCLNKIILEKDSDVL